MNKSTLTAALATAYDTAGAYISDIGYDDPYCGYDGGDKSEFIALMTGPADDIAEYFEGQGYSDDCAQEYLSAVASGDDDALEQVDLLQLACEFLLGDNARYFDSWQESAFANKVSYMKLWDFLLNRADILINDNKFEVGDFDSTAYLMGLFVDGLGYNIDVTQDIVLAAMRGDINSLALLDADIVRYVTE